jgi:fumarate reductase flavoprotein subunit
MDSDRTVKPENLEAQVVVIGGGGAGFAAAVAAAEKGADVILLEKRRKAGGNTAMARGFFAAESPVHKRMGVDAPTRDEFFKHHMEFARWKINARLVRALIDKSGDTVRWLEEKGMTFELPVINRPFWRHRYPYSQHVPEGHGAAVIKVLAKNLEDLGGRLFCNTGAKEILIDNKKAVAGVVAARKDEEIRIKAKSVIIATGGFAGNKELLRKYCPEYRENSFLRGAPNMGDGLLMATKVGAATEGLGTILGGGITVPGVRREVWVVAAQPNTIWVNKLGERYTDEASTNPGMAVFQQPEAVSYTLLDDALFQKFNESITGSGNFSGMEVANLVLPGEKVVSDLGELLRSTEEKGKAKISNSWDEIANWMGADPKVLRATIDEYNSFCNKGHDELFAKEPRYLIPLRTPPYYGIRGVTRLVNTFGGIKINHHTEVIDHEDNPIPGLYAAGIDTGGWESDTYNIYLYGHAFGFALNSGRIAGENAIKYIIGK